MLVYNLYLQQKLDLIEFVHLFLNDHICKIINANNTLTFKVFANLSCHSIHQRI